MLGSAQSGSQNQPGPSMPNRPRKALTIPKSGLSSHIQTSATETPESTAGM